MPRGDEIDRFLLEHSADHPNAARLAAERFDITRQAVNRRLRALVHRGLLAARGKTRKRRYSLVRLAGHTQKLAVTPELEEDVVWRERILPVLSDLPVNVVDICNYGFTEMLNNVKDHSRSPTVIVGAELTAVELQLVVLDDGIGIFRKIREACGLDSEREAVFELTKGKFTTDPERHTGEGIFFTSRMFDHFAVLSGDLSLLHEREGEDWLIEQTKDRSPGTFVRMRMDPASSHTTQEVFGRYAADQDDYAFRRTHLMIGLAKGPDEKLVSRSQAKRIMAGLSRFRDVILDFKGVDSIGPAFADEMFRVFHNAHPEVVLTPMNVAEDVGRMIRRAQAGGNAGDR